MTPQKQTRSVEEIAEATAVEWLKKGGALPQLQEVIAAALQAYGDQVREEERAGFIALYGPILDPTKRIQP
jgi:hypothetical protein